MVSPVCLGYLGSGLNFQALYDKRFLTFSHAPGLGCTPDIAGLGLQICQNSVPHLNSSCVQLAILWLQMKFGFLQKGDLLLLLLDRELVGRVPKWVGRANAYVSESVQADQRCILAFRRSQVELQNFEN